MSPHPKPEIRRAASLSIDQGRLVGYAARFNSMSQDLGGFVETIQPGAFTRTLKDADNVMALYGHDDKQVLGRVGAGTLRLSEDDSGLRYELDLPDTTLGSDLGKMVRRGDVTGASFGFHIKDQKWDHSQAPARRELLDVVLLEISITAFPAYPQTSVTKRLMRQFDPQAAYRERTLVLTKLRAS